MVGVMLLKILGNPLMGVLRDIIVLATTVSLLIQGAMLSTHILEIVSPAMIPPSCLTRPTENVTVLPKYAKIAIFSALQPEHANQSILTATPMIL